MEGDSDNGRLNIRVEIKNNASEPMDVDEKSEEEGEIRDTFPRAVQLGASDRDDAGDQPRISRKYLPTFEEFDPHKLQERAKRFALKPDEIKSFCKQDLHNLYKSLGITIENSDQVRFEALYMRSSSHMNIDNVMAYFREYAPVAIEWIDDESCNIVWEDRLFTAKTLSHISQIVKGMPVRIASEHSDNFILDDDKESNSLLNRDRQIELREDPEEFDLLPSEIEVDLSEINIPIPPGYWRLGKKLLNSFSVLLRFSMKIDKKPTRIIKCNKYLKSAPLNKIEQRGIFSRNKDINKLESEKNPWGILAENWDEDFKFREREHFNTQEQVIEKIDNSELRTRLTARRRLGKKDAPTETNEIIHIPVEKASDESEQENGGSHKKMPRMRMYADEEEEKIKRRKFLQTLKKQTEKLKESEIPNSDLRNILRITNRKSTSTLDREQDIDLSRTLKNRTRQLVFTVAQESISPQNKKRHIMDRLDKFRSETRDKKPILPIRYEEEDRFRDNHRKKHTHDAYRERNAQRTQSSRREKSPDRRYGGGMYSSRDKNTHDVQKTKSKVALVIKTQKKPTVASAIQSRNRKFDVSSTSDEDNSSEDSESDSSEGDSEASSSSSSEDSEINPRKVRGRDIGKVSVKTEIKK